MTTDSVSITSAATAHDFSSEQRASSITLHPEVAKPFDFSAAFQIPTVILMSH